MDQTRQMFGSEYKKAKSSKVELKPSRHTRPDVHVEDELEYHGPKGPPWGNGTARRERCGSRRQPDEAGRGRPRGGGPPPGDAMKGPGHAPGATLQGQRCSSRLGPCAGPRSGVRLACMHASPSTSHLPLPTSHFPRGPFHQKVYRRRPARRPPDPTEARNGFWTPKRTFCDGGPGQTSRPRRWLGIIMEKACGRRRVRSHHRVHGAPVGQMGG